MPRTKRVILGNVVFHALQRGVGRMNFGHFVLWPEGDRGLSAFLRRLTNAHTQRWQRAKNEERLREGLE
jgi:hypothetical protein